MAELAGMRIAVLTWRDVRHPEAGGSERYVHEVARRWVRDGHRVTIFTARPDGLPAQESIDGVAHTRLGSRLTVFPRALSRWARALRDVDVTLEVINGVPFGTPIVRRRGVVALVHHVHRGDWLAIYPDIRGRAGWFLESRVTPRLYRSIPFVTVSQASRTDLLALGYTADDVHVVPGGSRSQPIDTVPPRARGARLCIVARLVPQKQIELALDAVAELRADFPEIRLDIVGTGWWESTLKSRAQILGIADRTTFHGYLTDRERDQVFAQSAVHLLPSLKEGWGLAISEAALQATPSIGFRASGGLRESIEHNVTGWLVSEGRSLATMVRHALRTDDLDRIGEAARAKAMQLDWNRTSQDLLTVLVESKRQSGPQRSP